MVLAAGDDGVQWMIYFPCIIDATKVHQACGHKLLLAFGLGDRRHRLVDTLGVRSVEATVHLGHEHGGHTHCVGSSGGPLVVHAAGNGWQRLVQSLACIVESKLHQMRRCKRVFDAASNNGAQRLVDSWHTGLLAFALAVARLDQGRADQRQLATVSAGDCRQRRQRIVYTVAALVGRWRDDRADH